MKVYKREELNSNMDCPHCPGEKMFSNGCGGKGMKVVNKLLSFLPSSKLFHGACGFHDIVYSLVSKAPIKVKYPNEVKYPNGRIYTLRNRKDCDDIWYYEMQEMCREVKWFRGVMEWAAKRNYEIVRNEGDSFFKHDH